MCDEEFALVFEQVKELSDKIQLAVEVPRITQRQVYRNNPPHTTPEEYYRRVVFIPMLDSVISDLKSRLSRDTLNSFRLTVLLLLQSSVKEISSMYGQLLGLTMPSTRATLILGEVHVWRSRWLRVKREGGIFPSSVEETAKECDRHLYPYVSSLLDIFISLPVSVASAERSFSTLRQLKTWLRAQMGQTRLSGLALLNMHRDIDISIDRVIDSSQLKNWMFANEESIKNQRKVSNENFISRQKPLHQLEGRSTEFLTYDEEKEILMFYEQKLFELCKIFKPAMPPSVVGTGFHYFKRFYLKNSVMDYHPRDILATCVYLAAKVDEFNVSIGSFVANLRGDQEKASGIILNNELLLMQQLGYQLTIHNPYRPIEGFLIDIKVSVTYFDTSSNPL
ncbi:hypothetical protein QYM36_014843 [Artemia franciscana]|uniref:Cyclin-like domain-containing protein n=1 Tax=Artemia franciscana TaxID=6661 RepID=A0AA88KYY1_ARTSF|nr:hypothetical protein QYM36_014843 [Artemia franciscana]